MVVQLAPAVLQRFHWYVYVIGVVPVQVPTKAVSVLATAAVPEIVGRLVLVGAPVLATTAVALESAKFDPPAFVAVTRTFSVLPASPATTVYVELVAPEMSMQFKPAVSHCFHW